MKMRKQRILGAVLVVISGIMLALACSGSTIEERDATAVLFTLPLGLYAIFTKEYILYDGETILEMEEPEEYYNLNTRKAPYHGKKTSN